MSRLVAPEPCWKCGNSVMHGRLVSLPQELLDAAAGVDAPPDPTVRQDQLLCPLCWTLYSSVSLPDQYADALSRDANLRPDLTYLHGEYADKIRKRCWLTWQREVRGDADPEYLGPEFEAEPRTGILRASRDAIYWTIESLKGEITSMRGEMLEF